MTDPDNCRANRNNRSLEQIDTVVVPPLQFGPGGMGTGGINQSMGSGGMGSEGLRLNHQAIATTSSSSGRPIRQPAAAADPFSIVIPATVLPEGWDAPLQNLIPRMVPPPPAPPLRRVRKVPMENSMPIMMPSLSAVHGRDNRLNQPTIAQPTVIIPQTILPEGWNAPLQHPIPRMVPLLPAPALRRIRPAPPPPAPNVAQEMANYQIRHEQALAVLEEQQRLRHEKDRQQALAILNQERQERARQEEELFRAEHIDLNPEHRPLNAAMAQRIFQGWEQQHEADLEEDFNDLGPRVDIDTD
ncbi:hypothetical protein J132_09912 [Termitomyces sp. J132]|nr:hypothetical protein J132_09912 [Termitomyces sp. J132]